MDVVFVGAGPTGALVARKLAGNGRLVLILEAGQRFGRYSPLENTDANAGKIMWRNLGIMPVPISSLADA